MKPKILKKPTELKRGEIPVNKKELKEHANVLRSVLREMDKIMKEPSTLERGSKIAKQMNRLDYSRQVMEHFCLNLPINKLNYDREIK